MEISGPKVGIGDSSSVASVYRLRLRAFHSSGRAVVITTPNMSINTQVRMSLDS